MRSGDPSAERNDLRPTHDDRRTQPPKPKPQESATRPALGSWRLAAIMWARETKRQGSYVPEPPMLKSSPSHRHEDATPQSDRQEPEARCAFS